MHSLLRLNNWSRGPWARACLLTLVVGAASCKKAPTASSTPGSATLVQGDQQSAQGGAELPNTIVVRVLGTDGAPLAKYSVGFIIARGGGAVSPASALTDENGEVKTKWTLGPTDVQQTLKAIVGPLEPLLITGFAIIPSELIVAQGNNQTAKAGAALPNQIVVRVIGDNNTPMKGIAVAFQVTAGGGLISPASGLTNALGEVQARWTLGPQAGLNSIVVSSGKLQPVSLNAVGQ